MNFARTSLGKSPRHIAQRLVAFAFGFACLSILMGSFPALAQSPADQLAGNIAGTIVDQSGSAVVGARISLTGNGRAAIPDAVTGADGQFSFPNVVAGPFQLTVSASGFETQTSSGTLHPGESYAAMPIVLTVATEVTQVTVTPSRAEEAQEEVQQEEKQRVLAFVPNFYVTYIPNAAPLNAKEKFSLAWKSSIDPVTFGAVAAIAGFQQEQNEFSGYGGGWAGYGRRYGASYGDTVIGTFLGGAVLPSLLKQDPRYFYKGTGTWRSRLFYALSTSVICKGDNGRWQTNYSNILGDLGAGAISNAYYPAQNRNGVALTFESALIGIGATAGANVLQEFVIKKLTPNLPGKH